MEIILQSQDHFNDLAVLDFESDSVSFYSKNKLFEKKTDKVQGYYSIRDDTFICFFRAGDKLFLKIDTYKIEFECDDRISIDSLPNDFLLFSIKRNNKEFFSWKYKPIQISPDISAFQMVNPMISEEDFDILLFVRNVINDAERKNRVFKHHIGDS